MEPAAESSLYRYARGRSGRNMYGRFSEQGINGADYNERMQGKTMRNKRDVWNISTNSYRMGEHFAMFPEQLVEPCILAGCPEDGVVLDPFFGSGTTGAVAKRLHRQCIGIELNPVYCKKAEERIASVCFSQMSAETFYKSLSCYLWEKELTYVLPKGKSPKIGRKTYDNCIWIDWK